MQGDKPYRIFFPVSSTLQNSAAQRGQQLNNAAAANASGYVSSANAWGGAIGNVGNQISQLLMLRQSGKVRIEPLFAPETK